MATRSRRAKTSPGRRLDRFPRRYCSVCGQVQARVFNPGPGGRPDACCPSCGSLERHRFLAVLVEALRPSLPDLGLLLDIAPSPQVTPFLAKLEPRRHVRLDLGADNRLVDVLGSLTQLPIATDTVDLLVCYHVLEHVPDDAAAMSEIARVLAPGGVGLVQVPFRLGTTTDEDPDASEEDRVRRFGQADHVRYYGDDFEDRLVRAGLSFTRVTPRAFLGERMATWLKLTPDELVWIVRASDHPEVPPPLQAPRTNLTASLDALVDEMTRMREKVVGGRRRLRELERELADARTRPTLPRRILQRTLRAAARARPRADA